MLAHVCARRRWRRPAGWCQAGLRLGLGFGSAGRPVASIPELDPLRSRSKPPANGCLKTVCAVGGWTEQLQRFRLNRCNCWIIADHYAPPGAL